MDKLIKERIRTFKDTVKTKNNNRILNIGNVWAWSVWDNGYKLNTIARDYDLRIKSMSEFQERYNFDFYVDMWTRNPMRISDAVGGGTFTLVDDPFAVYLEDRDYLKAPEDYDLMLEDYKKFIWTKLIPRKLPNLLKGDSIEMLKEAGKEIEKYYEFNENLYQHMLKNYSVMDLFSGRTEFFAVFMENLYIDTRGMKGVSIDMRRHHDKLKEVCDHFGVYGLDTASREMGSDPSKPADYTICGIAQAFMSRKQFEVFYYPYLKQIFDYAEKYDKIIFCFMEGKNEIFYEYLQEAPKGHIVYYFENDDIFKAKKVFKDNVALAGGMPSEMLYRGSSQQCEDYAKKLIDEIGYDGAYFFGVDKMMSYPIDGKRENLMAVNRIVEEYGKY